MYTPTRSRIPVLLPRLGRLAAIAVVWLTLAASASRAAPAAAQSGPSITSTEGAWKHGQTVKVYGNVGSGSVRVADDFSLFPDNDFGGWSIFNADHNPVEKHNDSPRTTWDGGWFIRRKSVSLGFAGITAGDHREYFASFYMRLSPSFDISSSSTGTHQFKIIRLYSTNPASDGQPITIYPAIGASDEFFLAAENVSPEVTRAQLQIEGIQNLRSGWHKMTVYIKKSSGPDANDGRLRVWWDNQLKFDWANHFAGTSITGDFDTDNADLAGDWALGDYFSSATDATYVDFDDVYLAYGQQRFELADNSDYGQAQNIEIQTPLTWNGDGTATLKVNQGTLPDGQAWLFVTDAQGVRSPGYPVMLGNAVPTATPSTAPVTPTPTPALATPVPTAASVDWPWLQQGSTGESVKSLQYLLRAHALDVAVDGDFGPQTDQAVRAYQSSNGLVVDGQVGPQTWGSIIITVQQGSQGDAVSAVQSQLASRGYAIAIDGDFGPQTDGVVRTFQSAQGLVVDGIAGPDSWRTLLSDAGRVTMTPTPAATSTPTLTPSPTPQPCYYIQSQLTGYVLDVQGGSTAQGTQVIVWTQLSPAASNQLWKVTGDGHIVSQLTGYVLDVQGGSTAQGTQVIVWPQLSPAQSNQLWTVAGDGHVVSHLTGYVLDVQGGSTAQGTQVIVWPQLSPAQVNQLWNLVPAPSCGG